MPDVLRNSLRLQVDLSLYTSLPIHMLPLDSVAYPDAAMQCRRLFLVNLSHQPRKLYGGIGFLQIMQLESRQAGQCLTSLVYSMAPAQLPAVPLRFFKRQA